MRSLRCCRGSHDDALFVVGLCSIGHAPTLITTRHAANLLLQLFRWEPPASAGGAGLQSSEKALLMKAGFSPGISRPLAAPTTRQKTQPGSHDDAFLVVGLSSRASDLAALPRHTPFALPSSTQFATVIAELWARTKTRAVRRPLQTESRPRPRTPQRPTCHSVTSASRRSFTTAHPSTHVPLPQFLIANPELESPTTPTKQTIETKSNRKEIAIPRQEFRLGAGGLPIPHYPPLITRFLIETPRLELLVTPRDTTTSQCLIETKRPFPTAESVLPCLPSPSMIIFNSIVI